MNRKLVTAAVAALLSLAATPPAAQAAFGLVDADASLRTPDGAPLLEAGAHPDLVTDFAVNKTPANAPDGNVKDVEVKLPPGLVGNPTNVPTCTQDELGSDLVASCDPNTQVGLAEIRLVNSGFEFTQPAGIYNVETPPGVGALFGFNVVNTSVLLESGVTNDGRYTLTTKSASTSQGLAIVGAKITIWGVPADPAHDDERFHKGTLGAGAPSTAPLKPLMSNPTECTGAPLTFEIRANSWGAPDVFDERTITADSDGNPMVMTGCENVEFDASVEAEPTSKAADSPTGLDLAISAPYSDDPAKPATALLRDAVVTLPEGMSVNAASAGGQAMCSEAQVNLGGEAPASCPPGSKIGTVTIDTPLLGHDLVGEVHLAQQRQNKFGSLLAIYFTIDDPKSGTVLKLAGEVRPDPQTGRLTISFPDNPPLPFTELQVHMFGGPRASLKTPPSCGTFSTAAEFTATTGEVVPASDSFEIATGPNGGPCPSGAFAPGFEAGTTDRFAGEHAPFVLRLTRADGMPALRTLDVTLPTGLLAKLAGAPYCPDAAIAAIPGADGTGRSQLAAPSCPAASRLGTVAVSTGVGPSPFPVETGSAYLAGPYKGAPVSLAFVTPAVAGPFDLGNVVVRTALHVDPVTAQVRAVSDPLPTILHGVPLDMREVWVNLDRPGFTLNPTSCAPKRIEATIGSVTAAGAPLGSPFQAIACRGLDFGPRLALRLKGKTHRSAHPALTATLTMPKQGANIGKAVVTLPKTQFLEQDHIRTICTRVQYAADSCPKAAIYGHAKAWTPLLDQPLRGPVYLRSSDNELPDLVADLNGQIEIDLAGRIDSVNSRMRTTFWAVPDAPVSKFVLRMQGGRKGLLVNNTELCKAKPRATAAFTGHNGRLSVSSPLVRVGCGGGKKRK